MYKADKNSMEILDQAMDRLSDCSNTIGSVYSVLSKVSLDESGKSDIEHWRFWLIEIKHKLDAFCDEMYELEYNYGYECGEPI